MRVSYFLLFKRIFVEESISYYDSKFVFKCDKDMILYCLLHVVNEIGLWHGRHGASRRMVLECRTPLMVASKYGSVDVVKLILSLSKADVILSLGPDKTTALHCAVSGGSEKAVETVKVLLQAGADPNATDANGCFPLDVIVAPLNCSNLKVVLQELLQYGGSVHALSVSFGFSSPFLSTTPTNNSLLSSIPDSTCNTYDIHGSSTPEKKEHPFDLSLPNIKDNIYATDEFRMFSFKIRPCSRAYSHDWTECPFVHPGENARRRDPRKFQYSCMPCLDFRKGTCRRGDLCEYAHGVFECWLHPAQYKTRLCKDGMSCLRQVCFFAHKPEEMRPLYVSTGSAMPSPHSATSAAAFMDMAATLNVLPGSTKAVEAIIEQQYLRVLLKIILMEAILFCRRCSTHLHHGQHVMDSSLHMDALTAASWTARMPFQYSCLLHAYAVRCI
ncbi:hypothetical protein ACFXTN_027682 [Malus domestica]